VNWKLFCWLFAGLILAACGEKTEIDKGQSTAPDPAQDGIAVPSGDTEDKAAVPAGKRKVILVTQSRFKANEKGQYTIPDAAEMLILTPSGSRWSVERIEDTESNVFHKALQYGDEGILTLGGNEAMLKLWRKKAGKWQAETLWHPVFGGEHNRLRDFEMADFDGDGMDDLAIATHDQGVVAVIWRRGQEWKAEELSRQKDTFVHEIEIGDLDQDGKMEIYATPSEPNTMSGKHQGGKVIRFAWNGETFQKSEVVSLDTRHIKEILVADVDGDRKPELYAALEAEVDGMNILKPVEVRRYDLKSGKFEESSVITLNDRFCRFLIAGDIDGDGKDELVASAFSAGVWVVEHSNDDGYTAECIDSKSGGFEHAAYISDVEGDGKMELYVADDKGGTIKRYAFVDGTYQPTIINRRIVPSQAMVWNITDAELSL
jgi:hypothetical protein